MFHADIQLDRTAVPFWPRHRTTKVALIKAPKYKANLATGEARYYQGKELRAPVQIHIQAGSLSLFKNIRSWRSNNAILHMCFSFSLSRNSFF